MPGSMHRKTGNPIEVKLFQMFREKTILLRREICRGKDLLPNNEFNELTFDVMKSWSLKCDEITKAEKAMAKTIINNTAFDQRAVEQINAIPIPEIIQALS